jgi:hypothetical protein
MLEQKLPKSLTGSWIWLSGDHNETNKYCYFRSDIHLDTVDPDAELLISAKSSFHLFINGKHIYFGESALDSKRTYVHSVDVGYCLQPGLNLIAISVHNSNMKSHNNFSFQSGGCWAELKCGDQVVLSTNESWYVRAATCLYSANLLKTISGGFTEKLDFNKVEKSWIDSSVSLSPGWGHPDIVIPIAEARKSLAEDLICGVYSNEKEVHRIVAKGVVRKHHFSSGVEYSEIMTRSGTYMAESYFLADSDGPVTFAFFCDGAYRLFCNDVLIKESSIQRTVNGEPIEYKVSIGDFDSALGTMNFQDGWNKVTVVQALDYSSYGFTLNIDADPIMFQLLREQTMDALPGWRISGPLNAPLDRITGKVNLCKTRTDFYSLKPLDEAAYMDALRFTRERVDQVYQGEDLILKENEYVVLDFGHIYYALPQLTLTGSKDDIVDLVAASRLRKGIAEFFTPGRSRNTESVILSGEQNRWIDFHPRGFRYLMVSVRSAKAGVKLSHIGLKVSQRDTVHQGDFSSSDSVLNRIWEISRQTIRSTVGFSLMSGAESEYSQYIVDAMIQSEVTQIIDGNSVAPLKALQEFAAIQYETGEMPAMHPCAIPYHYYDFMMSFPEWLKRYQLYTGEAKALMQFKETVENLFLFLESKSIPGQDVFFLDNDEDREYFIDNGFGELRGISTGLNALYIRSLRAGAWLMREFGDEDLATSYENRAENIQGLILGLCWDVEKNSFHDYWDAGELSESCSWQTDILALYGGLATDEFAATIIAQRFMQSVPYASFFDDGLFSPFFMYFVLESLFMNEESQLAIKLMKYFYGRLATIDGTETWPELFAPTTAKKAGSSCMGYGVSPVIFISHEVAGLTPATAGYHKMYFKPRFDVVENLKIKLPTPSGAIVVEWERVGELSVAIRIEAHHPIELIPIFSVTDGWEVEFSVSDAITVIES